MGRPRISEGEAGARERMIEAFWTLMRAEPFARMTVAKVVASAGLNRNAFYYHYGNLEELAEDAVAETIPADAPRLIVSFFADEEEEFKEFLSAPDRAAQYERLRLLIGSHGSSELRGWVRDLFIRMWCEKFGIAAADLTRDETITLRFAFGGIVEILGDWDALIGDRSLDLLLEVPPARLVMGVVVQTLRNAADRARAADRATLDDRVDH